MYVAATTEERKPPTLADIVREKTDDGRRIIDFFLDVMEDRIEGAELCHRMDAARQLEKHKSKAAAKELIVHIVRDEQPDPLPSEASASVSAEAPSSVRAEPVLSTVEEPVLSLPKEPFEAQPDWMSVVPERTAVVPAEAGTHPPDPEPIKRSQLETGNSL